MSFKEAFAGGYTDVDFLKSRFKTDELPPKHMECRGSAPFTVATSGSNDRNSDCSLYPIVVSYFNVVLGKIVTVLLALGTCTEGATA